MKIKSANQGIIDTDKLPDSQAELGEEIERVKKFVSDRNGEIFVWMKVPGKMAWASSNLNEISSVASVIQTFDKIFKSATNDKMGIVVLPVNVIAALKKELDKEDGNEKDNL
jgi:hypothetical protein